MELKPAQNTQYQIKLDEKKDLQRKTVKQIGLIIIYILLGLWAVFTFVPLLWMLSSSFKDTSAITAVPPQLIPKNPTLDSYKRIFEVGGLGRWFINSTIVAGVSTIINVF